MAGLRERRHRQTRHDIVEAAFVLFTEHGYAEVTMEQIAAAAGVSRSTAYRRFPTKEDVVLDVTRRWLDVFDEAAAELAPDTSLAEAFAVTARAVSAHIDENLERVIQAYTVLDEAPALASSGVATTAWLGRMVALSERYGRRDEESAAVIAGAYLGGIDTMMRTWAERGGAESVGAATERLILLLDPLVR